VSESKVGVNDAAFRTESRRWLAHTSELLAPLLRAGASLVSHGAPSERASWRKGLILGHNHIGDVMYRTCSLGNLRSVLPDCEWSYLTAPASAELLKGNRSISEVLPWNIGEDSWTLSDGAFGELRRRQFDAVLCTNTLRHFPDLSLAVALGIPNRVGYTYKGLSGFITRAAPLTFPSAYAEYFRGMVADLGNRAPDWPLTPQLFPDAADLAAATQAWNGFGLAPGRQVIACCVTTRQAAGNWPKEHILAALTSARSVREFDVVLCGAFEDSATLSDVARSLPFPTRVLAGGLGLRAFVAFLTRCTALVTLDSGPRHLGNAAAIPVLFARNLSHSRVEAGKYCETEIDLAPPLEFLNDEETRRAIGGISPAATAERIVAALGAA
jgi:ADP-heptose:LPS heptosyltransferase